LSLSILRESIKRGLIPLDCDQLLSAAIRKSGLKYSGDKRCEESLRILVDSCNAEAGLSLIGQMATRQHLVELLATRLGLIDYWQRTPEIQEQVLRPQIIITGLPKSVSTFLHRLLAHDQNNRVPKMWEVMFPLPFPGCMTPDSDPRIKKADNRLRWLRWTHPALAQAHPIGALIPQECGAILGYTFESNVFLDMFLIPSYEAWLRSRDAGPAYEFHKMFLKHLQWLCPADRWALKSSDHVHNLETLIRRYPEARIIFLHRDPIKVLQAASSQMTLVKSLFSRSIDHRLLGNIEDRHLHDKVNKIMKFRDSHDNLEDRFMDIRYLDLASDPVGIVRAIYDCFGLALPVEAEARMDAFAAAERNKKRSDRFLLSDFSLNPEQEYPSFDLYCRRFGVGREAL
jgi:hypothetical protein